MEEAGKTFTYETRRISNLAQADELIALIRESGECAVDTETDGLYWALGNKPFMATFAPNTQVAYWTFDPDLTARVLNGMQREGAAYVFHNAVFDLHMLRVWGWSPPGGYRSIWLEDTMHAFRIQYPGESAALKVASKRFVKDMDVDGPQALVRAWLKEHTTREKVAGKMVTREPGFHDVPEDIMVPYATQDVILTLRAHHALREERRKWAQPERCIGVIPPIGKTYDDEMEMVKKAIVELERKGMPVSMRFIRSNLARTRTELERLRKDWIDSPYGEYSPTSHVQIKKLVYEVLGEPIKHRSKPTKTAPNGSPSSGEAAMVDFETPGGKAVAAALLPMRAVKKFEERLTEIDSFVASDGRVHTSLRSDTARTGRFGSSEPALQNLSRPDKTKWYTMARAAFCPPPGKEFMLADFSQIELRLAAHFMNDPVMIESFITGVDFHSLTAARMYGIPVEQVAKKMRAIAKILNFSILYGAGVRKVTETLRYGAAGTDPLTVDDAMHALLQLIPDQVRMGDPQAGEPTHGFFEKVEDAELEQGWRWVAVEDARLYQLLGQSLLDAYHRENPKVREFTNKASGQAKKYGGVFTSFGLWIPIPKPSWSNELQRMLTYDHKAGNAIIQGTAAGLMKATLVRAVDACYEYCEKNGLVMWEDIALLMSIHDEMIFEVPVGHAKPLAQFLDPLLSPWPQFRVPIKLEYAHVPEGSNWAEKVDLPLEEAA